MGSSGYLAAKSEREVYDHEIAMEREEIRLMPEVEEEEMALIYQAKGIPEADARRFAADVMKDPERALAEQVDTGGKLGADGCERDQAARAARKGVGGQEPEDKHGK